MTPFGSVPLQRHIAPRPTPKPTQSFADYAAQENALVKGHQHKRAPTGNRTSSADKLHAIIAKHPGQNGDFYATKIGFSQKYTRALLRDLFDANLVNRDRPDNTSHYTYEVKP